MGPSGLCPNCKQQVEWTKIQLDTFRCNNCWHLVDKATLAKLEQLAADVKAHDEERAKLFDSLR